MPATPNGNGRSAAPPPPVSPEALRRTVQQPPPWQGAFAGEQTLFFVGQTAEEITPWGTQTKLRDKQLREFITVEPKFNSALGIVAARNAAFAWKLEGPEQEVEAAQLMLNSANFGAGWANFIQKLTVDLCTQDAGAFVEIIRAGDSPDAPVVGIANLDAMRCYHTGLPEVPVLYLDRMNRYHYLKWYQVVTFTDMPATIEGLPGLQYCALTRLLRQARIIRDIQIYLQEKVGGRRTRAITLVKGVTTTQINEAYEASQSAHDASGLMRFSMPLLIGAVNPNADIGFDTLEISSLPDGFDLDVSDRQYILQLAMAFQTDYQEFAPLPGGNLGTSQQSQILHEKSRGKGPGLFQTMIKQALNFFVLPEALEFQYDEQDLDADAQMATIKLNRAQERAARIVSTEITVQVAQQIALQAGDLTEEQMTELEKANKAAEEEAARQQKLQEDMAQQQIDAQTQAQQPPGQNPPSGAAGDTTSTGDAAPGKGGGGGTQTSRGQTQKTADETVPPVTAPAPMRDAPGMPRKSGRTAVEERVAKVIEDAFEELHSDLLAVAS